MKNLYSLFPRLAHRGIFAAVIAAAAVMALFSHSAYSAQQAAPDANYRFCFLIYKDVDEDIVKALAPAIETDFRFKVEILDKRPQMPAAAFDKKRKQYRAAGVLEDAMKHKTPDCVRLVAFVPGDMYLGKQDFTYGLADTDWRGAVISFARLASGEKKRFYLRAYKASLHELGHTFGLVHCAVEDGCIMTPPRSISALDAAPAKFCRADRRKLDDAIERLKRQLYGGAAGQGQKPAETPF